MTSSRPEEKPTNDQLDELSIEPKSDRLVWIDLEMTGLNPAEHTIVEVAAIITDAELNILDGCVDMVVHATDDELAKMDDIVTEMHAASGLTDKIQASTHTLAEAEQAVLELVSSHCDPLHPAPLAGNSIATDRAFIREHMPELDAALHYRMIDVSSIKELARRWYPRTYFRQPKKGMAHRALADIIESVRELDYYRRTIFVNRPGPGSTAADSSRISSEEAYPITAGLA